MTETEFFTTPGNRRIAYHEIKGQGPLVVFLGGFKSDMDGTKARHLEGWAQRRGRAFLRFDYSGHGQSSGRFEDGAIGDWANDAVALIAGLGHDKVILVGSSMGGWISLLVARALPALIAGFVGIAAAPDFTEDSMWHEFSDEMKAQLMAEGRIELPSGYDDGPYVITRRLIEEGRAHLVLRGALELPFPVRLLQGTADRDVDMSVALGLLDHAEGPDIRLTIVKGADHRFSSDACLRLIDKSIHSVLQADAMLVRANAPET